MHSTCWCLGGPASGALHRPLLLLLHRPAARVRARHVPKHGLPLPVALKRADFALHCPPCGAWLTLQRALVHFVYQHVAGSSQRWVGAQAAQQDAGGAEEQAGVAGRGSVQAHVIPHLLVGERGAGRFAVVQTGTRAAGLPSRLMPAARPRLYLPHLPCTRARRGQPRLAPPPRALPPRWLQCVGAACRRWSR